MVTAKVNGWTCTIAGGKWKSDEAPAPFVETLDALTVAPEMEYVANLDEWLARRMVDRFGGEVLAVDEEPDPGGGVVQ